MGEGKGGCEYRGVWTMCGRQDHGQSATGGGVGPVGRRAIGQAGLTEQSLFKGGRPTKGKDAGEGTQVTASSVDRDRPASQPFRASLFGALWRREVSLQGDLPLAERSCPSKLPPPQPYKRQGIIIPRRPTSSHFPTQRRTRHLPPPPSPDPPRVSANFSCPPAPPSSKKLRGGRGGPAVAGAARDSGLSRGIGPAWNRPAQRGR